jgi:multidrug resistance efflux pump
MNRQIQINKYEYEYERKLPSSIKNAKTEKELYYRYKLSLDELSKYKASYIAQLENNRKNLLALKLSLEQQILKTEKTYSYLVIKAPVSGYVQEITQLNPGDYVFANQRILKIIPTNKNEFKIQLSVPTKDIGEIKEGTDVKYRLSAFPFFEYRGAEGKIVSIDPDIRQNENNQLVYLIYSDINKTSFVNYAGEEYPLRAGIEVDARIVMNKIQLISYIFRKMGYIK